MLGAAALALNATKEDGAAAVSPDENSRVTKSTVQFDGRGELLQPAGYRKWIHIGTPLTPNDMNNGNAAFPEFHSVYMDPESFEHYEKTGYFRNGTVVVKELLSVGAKQASSGKGYFMGEFTGLEVAIKDAVRFPDEPGHWAYFSFGHKYPLKPTASSQEVASCNACHGGLADDDFVFTQYYPVLWAARSTFTSTRTSRSMRSGN